MKIMCNILQQYYCRVYTAHYTAIFIWWWIWVHISMWQSLPAITWLWLVHVVLIFICVTDRDSQCWKIKIVQSSKQWYDSDLHGYLTFSSECLNMSHGISGRYYLRVVILAWRCLSGVNYFDRWTLCAIFCNSVTVECVIIQQFSSGGEFGGTFLCDSPCRPLHDCGLYTLFQWPFSWQIKTISLQKSIQCTVVNSDMILTCTAI